MSVPVRQGEMIPLVVFLGEASTDRVLKADLRNLKTDTVFQTDVILANKAAGEYINTAIAMPGANVSARIKLFENDGTTPLSPTSIVGEVFTLKDPLTSPNALEGRVESDTIVGELNDDIIEGRAESNAAIGTVGDSELLGNAGDSDTIEGDLP